MSKVKMTEEQVPQLLEKVEARIAAIKKVKYVSLETEGTEIYPFGEVRYIDRSSRIIKAIAHINSEQVAYDNAAIEDLGLDLGSYPEYKHKQYTAAEWIEDLRNQYDFLATKEELAKLTRAKADFELLLSDEDKKSNKIAAVQATIGE